MAVKNGPGGTVIVQGQKLALAKPVPLKNVNRTFKITEEMLDQMVSNYERSLKSGYPPAPGFFAHAQTPEEVAARKKEPPALHVLRIYREGDALFSDIEYQPDAWKAVAAESKPWKGGSIRFSLFASRWVWSSWREWKAAYSLEREFSQRHLGQAAAITGLIIVLFCAEFIMASFVIPGLPAEVFLSTPTLDLISTPGGNRPLAAQTESAGLPLALQQQSTGCTPGRIDLTSPESAAEVSGVIELKGTVDIPNFGFYKYEVSPLSGETWATIAAGRTAVRNGALGKWDTTALTPGDYMLRLVATDNEGSLLPACIITLRIVPPS